jgi:hypothetical protein
LPLAFSVFPMSAQLYTVLNLFESPRGHLAEISRTLRHSPEAWVSEWLWIEQRHVMTLQPLAGHTAGTFEEGQLHLGENAGELCWQDGRIEVLARVDKLPPTTRSFLELHLS